MVPVVLRHNLRLLLGFDHMWHYYYCNSLFVCWHNTYSFGPRSSTLKRGKARVYLLKSIDPDLAHLMDKLSWDNGIKSSSRIFVKELVFVNELVFQWRLWTGLIETVLAAGTCQTLLFIFLGSRKSEPEWLSQKDKVLRFFIGYFHWSLNYFFWRI